MGLFGDLINPTYGLISSEGCNLVACIHWAELTDCCQYHRRVRHDNGNLAPLLEELIYIYKTPSTAIYDRCRRDLAHRAYTHGANSAS